MVHTSTSEVYGTAQTVPITEDHPLEAQSPYAASKIGADKLMDSFHRSFELPAVVLRPFNTYGPRQSARAVIPTIITQALAGSTLRLGSLDPKRDLTFVEDTVAGFIAVAGADGVDGKTVQLGTGQAVSIGDLVDMVAKVLDKELHVELDPARVRPAASEVRLLLSDPSQAQSLCGWQHQVDLQEGIARTIDWIRVNQERYRVGEYVT
jgi:nucleoside-diphosphate-sugar epimerase